MTGYSRDGFDRVKVLYDRGTAPVDKRVFDGAKRGSACGHMSGLILRRGNFVRP